MNVLEATQSFQSLIDSISTTTDQYVSKDLFQTCMASFANSFIQLSQNVNQLSWSFRSGIQTLSDKLSHLDEATQCLQTNNVTLSDRLDSNNSKIFNNLKELSDRVEQTDINNKQNFISLSSRLKKLEESSFSIQGNIKSISHKLNIAESKFSASDKIIKELSDKVSEACENVDGLKVCSSTLMSDYQHQQTCIESLINDVAVLQQKSTQLILHSTPQPPPGFSHRTISNTPFFPPKTPPGFETVFTPLHSAMDLSSHLDTMKTGEISPVTSVKDTAYGPVTPVSQTDKDGNADLQCNSAGPSKSITVRPTDPFTTELSPVSYQISSETEIARHSYTTSGQNDNSSQSAQVVETPQESSTNICDSGIVSMLDQTSLPNMVQLDQNSHNSQELSPVNTLSTLSEENNIETNQCLVHITSESSKTNTGEEISTVSSQSLILTPCFTSPFSIYPIVTSVEGQKIVSSEPTLKICVDPVKALTHNAPHKCMNQPSVSPMKLFDEVMQSEGHKEYGKLHPVRRPWQLFYNTLRWLKPFK